MSNLKQKIADNQSRRNKKMTESQLDLTIKMLQLMPDQAIKTLYPNTGDPETDRVLRIQRIQDYYTESILPILFEGKPKKK